MKTTEYIEYTINRLPKGYVFTYNDFMIDVNRKEAVIKALNRMASTGKIVKLAKGKYYKPENSIFGKLQPNQYQIIKDLLERNGKVTGYLTGYSIYNQLGLTTQVSNTIQIGKNETRPTFKRGNYTVSFVQQKNNITKESIPLLQILDSMRYIKKLPDTNPYKACERFLSIIKDLSERDKISLVRLANKYPPATIALLGAIMEETGNNTLTQPLQNILNPITNYKLNGVNKLLSSANKWNIK
jgi:hypothetical protein